MMIVITVVNNDEQQPLAFGGRCCRPWQWQWQSSTVVMLTTTRRGGADKFGRRTMQQVRSDRQHINQPSTGASEVQ